MPWQGQWESADNPHSVFPFLKDLPHHRPVSSDSFSLSISATALFSLLTKRILCLPWVFRPVLGHLFPAFAYCSVRSVQVRMLPAQVQLSSSSKGDEISRWDPPPMLEGHNWSVHSNQSGDDGSGRKINARWAVENIGTRWRFRASVTRLEILLMIIDFLMILLLLDGHKIRKSKTDHGRQSMEKWKPLLIYFGWTEGEEGKKNKKRLDRLSLVWSQLVIFESARKKGSHWMSNIELRLLLLRCKKENVDPETGVAAERELLQAWLLLLIVGRFHFLDKNRDYILVVILGCFCRPWNHQPVVWFLVLAGEGWFQ